MSGEGRMAPSLGRAVRTVTWIVDNRPAMQNSSRLAWSSIAASIAFPSALVLVWTGPFDLALFGAPVVMLLWLVVAYLVRIGC